MLQPQRLHFSGFVFGGFSILRSQYIGILQQGFLWSLKIRSQERQDSLSWLLAFEGMTAKSASLFSFHFLSNWSVLFIDMFISGLLGQIAYWLKSGLYSYSREAEKKEAKTLGMVLKILNPETYWHKEDPLHTVCVDFQKAIVKVPHQRLLAKPSFHRIGRKSFYLYANHFMVASKGT